MKSLFILSLLLYSVSNAQWERVPEIPETSIVYALLSVHDTLYAATDTLVYVGASEGTSWFAGVPPVAHPDAANSLLKVNNVLLAGTFQNGIFRSTNNGLSWQSFSNGLSGLGGMDIGSILVRRDSLIAGTFGAGVFTTAADFTHPWSSWGDSISDYQGDNVFKMLTVGNTVPAGAGSNGEIFRYTDAQPWWNPIPMSTPPHFGLTVSGMASGTTAALAATTGGIYRTTDEGLTWKKTSVSLSTQTISVILMYHGTTFFSLVTTTSFSSLLKSSDEGITWESLGVVAVPYPFDIAIAGDTFYLGSVEGLWKASLSGLLTTVASKTTTPVTYRLRQNYPNPFNPTTTIEYSIERESPVTLRIFDNLGRELATLVNEKKDAGRYSVQWDASARGSGIYFYTLQAGIFRETKRMILIK